MISCKSRVYGDEIVQASGCGGVGGSVTQHTPHPVAGALTHISSCGKVTNHLGIALSIDSTRVVDTHHSTTFGLFKSDNG